MTAEPNWLDRLNTATSYQQLHDVLAGLMSDASALADRTEVARAMDEAVHRLELERTDDEEQLREIQARYEAFKADHRGLFGWLKRHMPFTRTRRQEVEHREGVADQQAEVLADNLIIARLQMAKERLPGTQDRTLGLRPGDWNERLRGLGARELDALADVLKQMSAEGQRSLAFVEALQADIEVFAGADFTAPQDRRRRDEDLRLAGEELAAIRREIDEELVLKRDGLVRLTSAVTAELEEDDADFRRDGAQIERIESALNRLGDSRAALAALTAQAGAVGQLQSKIASLPQELAGLQKAIQGLESRRGELSVQSARAAAIADERRARFEEADAAARRQEDVLAGAKRAYDAYHAQSKAGQKQPIAVEADPSSPMWQPYSEAQAADAAAKVRRAESLGPYEAARRDADAARSALEKLSSDLAAQRARHDELERSEPRLRRELGAAVANCHTAFSAASLALAAYLSAHSAGDEEAFRPQDFAGQAMGWLNNSGIEPPLAEALVADSANGNRQAEAMAVIERLLQWHHSQRQALDRQRSAARQRRDAAWRSRCCTLLGEALAAEACGA